MLSFSVVFWSCNLDRTFQFLIKTFNDFRTLNERLLLLSFLDVICNTLSICSKSFARVVEVLYCASI